MSEKHQDTILPLTPRAKLQAQREGFDTRHALAQRLVPDDRDKQGSPSWRSEIVDLDAEAERLRRKNRRIRFAKQAGAVLGTAAAVAALIKPATHLVESWTQPEVVTTTPNHERSMEGICAPLSPDAEHLLQTDCNLLPVFEEVPTFESDPLDPKPIATGDDLSPLDADHRQAIEAAISDPLGKLLADKYPIEVYQLVEGQTLPGKMLEDGHYQDGKLQFQFAANQPPELYLTWGKVRSVLIHEGTHGLSHEWLDDKQDKETQANIQKLSQLWMQDTRITLEEFRLKNKNQLSETFRNVQQILEHKLELEKPGAESSLPTIIKAVTTYQQQLNKPNGLLQTNILHEKGAPYPQLIDPAEAISWFSDETANWDEYFRTPEEREEFKKLSTSFYPDMDKMTTFASEKQLMPGIMKAGGHAYHSWDERGASTVASIQMNPEGAFKAINALPKNRRVIQEQFIATIFDQLKHDNPDIAAQTNIQFVLDRVEN